MSQNGSKAIFSELDLREEYFPMIARNENLSFFGVPPAPVFPKAVRKPNRHLLHPSETLPLTQLFRFQRKPRSSLIMTMMWGLSLATLPARTTTTKQLAKHVPEMYPSWPILLIDDRMHRQAVDNKNHEILILPKDQLRLKIRRCGRLGMSKNCRRHFRNSFLGVEPDAWYVSPQ